MRIMRGRRPFCEEKNQGREVWRAGGGSAHSMGYYLKHTRQHICTRAIVKYKKSYFVFLKLLGCRKWDNRLTRVRNSNHRKVVMAEEAAPGIDVDALVEAERTQLEEEREKHKQRQENHDSQNHF